MSFKIYCNLCFELQSQCRRKCFVTSCSHVICETCYNTKNFCSVCAKNCRVFEINSSLPNEVKAFFEDTSAAKMGSNISKIQSFQENQAKMFVEKASRFESEYKELATKLTGYGSKTNEIKNIIRSEIQLIDKMKSAYKDNRVQPELFNMKSPAPIAFNSQPRSASPSVASSHHSSSTNKNHNIKSTPSIISSYRSVSNEPSTSNRPQLMTTPIMSASSSRSPYANVLAARTLGFRPGSSIESSTPSRDNSTRSSRESSIRSSSEPKSPSLSSLFQSTHDNLLRNHLIQMQKQNLEKYMAMRREQTRK